MIGRINKKSNHVTRPVKDSVVLFIRYAYKKNN